MTTALAIPKKIATHQPKPTKAQLVDALVERAREAHRLNEDQKDIKRSALEQEGIRLVLEAFKKAKPTDEDVTLYSRWRCNDSASVTVEITSPSIRTIQTKLHKLYPCTFKEEETKRVIRDSLKTPNPLLGCDDDTAKALDQLLERIMNIKPAIEA
jgi:hypothetical protein